MKFITIIDDDEEDIFLIQETLTSILTHKNINDIKVLGFSSAEQAIESFRSIIKNIIFIICDIHLPGKDAFGALEEISTYTTHIPVVLTTGVDNAMIDIAKLFGVKKGVDVISTLRKPISTHALEKLIATYYPKV